MKRKDFIHSVAPLLAFPIVAKAMNVKALQSLFSGESVESKMPVLFLGHGNPMNALQENEFVSGFRKVAGQIPKPTAILCISAHWETPGTFITAMEKPKTIHDFGGFPKALFDVQYPAPGSPELAQKTKSLITSTEIVLDQQWGLDHGAWTVLKHLYPNADVPVVQMSIDYRKPPQYHYDLAKELSALRKQGVLIVGSGNMVHNLGMVAWDRLNDSEYGYDWALEAREKMNHFILNHNHDALIKFKSQGKAFDLSIPTPEHFLPLLYTLALREDKDEVSLFNDKPIAGSLTMTSVRIG